MTRSKAHQFTWITGLLAIAALTISAGAATAQDTDKAASVDAAVAQPPVYYMLALEGAMFAGDNPKQVREIVLDLERIGDKWGAIYGFSRDYNMATHRGAVTSAKIEGDQIELKISTDLTPDKWIPGGQGTYTVKLKQHNDGRLTGTFKGKFRGKKVEGEATGSVYETKRADGYKPLADQEHPRLLFRKHELPALRDKMKTPFGQAAIEKLKKTATPSALGLLYQLTGDKEWAKKAEKEAELYLSGKKPGADPFVPKRPLWGRLEELALVYDLCYDALSDDFKKRYRAWISNFTFQVYFAPESLGTTNWHVVSNHVANVYSGVTLSALTLFDEPSEAPEPPTPPYLEDTLPPAKDFEPGKDVPVVELTPGKSPTKWLRTEPLRTATPDDPREVFYGLEDVHAEPGTQVQVGDFQLTFQKMQDEEISNESWGGITVGHMIDANAKAQAKKPFTMVIYTVIKVDKPGQYVVQVPNSRANLAQISLAGELLAHGQVIKLEKGLYPMMCMVQWRMRWGHIAPLLRPANDDAIAAWKTQAEAIRQKHETRKQAYATVLAKWKRSGGGNPAFQRMYRLGRMTSALHCRHAIGRGGFQGEVGHYSMDASSGHAKLWPMYRRVMGYDITPHHEYPDYIPRKLIGGPQDINGTTAIGGQFFAALFPSIKSEYKPEVLGAWQREMKVADSTTAASVLDREPVFAFINYPLDMKTAPLGTNLPTVWRAPDFGYYAFRSGWGKDAFIAQVFLKSQMISGWNGENAGTWRLRGLGTNWVKGPTDRVRRREQENIVWLPGADMDEGARAHLTHYHADDKTMTLTANMDEVYEREDRLMHSKYGDLVRVRPSTKKSPTPESSGITGLRAFGFDYSGTSGAPCLIAIVDKINGGDDVKRFWLLQPETRPTSGKRKKGEPSPVSEVVKPTERGFILTPPDTGASMRGVFAHPAAVNVSTEPLVYEYTKNWGTQRGSKHTVTIAAMTVPGSDHFFWVGTVGEGNMPEAKVDGKGLDAVITVGKRTVKFDGKRIVFGEK